jgi:methyltransferase (TIGR00027 family)
MKTGDPRSHTAEAIALFRAIETSRTGSKRLFEDPYAATLLSGPFKFAAHVLRLPVGANVLAGFFDRAIPGVRGSAVVRTRLIDDAIQSALDAGCAQVVLLGAGFDSRPYRLAPLSTVDVYEVDRALIQQTKIARLRKSIGSAPDNVRFVDVDFERDDMGKALRDAGLRSELPTVFVWEGVTYYLTAEAVDCTVRLVAELGAPGSRLILTYMDRGAVDGTTDFSGASRWLTAVRRVGEHFTFGLDPSEVPTYLAVRTFDLLSDVTTADAALSCFEPLNRRDRASEFEHVVTAVRRHG